MKRRSLWPWITGTALVCFGLGFVLGSAGDFDLRGPFFARAESPLPHRPATPRAVGSRAGRTDPSVRAEPTARPEPVPSGGARVAIVVDDLGRSLGELEQLAGLGVPLTYSVLPFESRTGEVVAALRRRGVEVICHLPMQPRNGADPGPGALTREMSHREMARATREALAEVPGAVGANNHMGSEISADSRAMKAILRVLAKRDLFYLDSRTSADSVGFTTALDLGLPAAERHVFLDTDRSLAAVRGQFDRLLARARQEGHAVAIGHPYPETLEILRAEIPQAIFLGYEFVPVSRLVRRR